MIVRRERKLRLRRGAFIIGLFAYFAVAFTYCHQRYYYAPTPLSRLNLLRSITERRTLEITAYHTTTADVAIKDGRYYSDKAPGTVALALPAFALARAADRHAGVKPSSIESLLIASWAATAFSQALPAALGGVALWCWLCRFTGDRLALLTAFAIQVGGLTLPYCTMLFSHALVIGLLFLAIWAVGIGFACDTGAQCFMNASVNGAGIRMVFAGLCLGGALASEYTSGIIVISIVFYVWWWNRSSFPRVAFGALAPLVLIPAYSLGTVGSIFSLPYSYQAGFPEMRSGIYGIGWPSFSTLCQILFSPARGLLFWSPFLLMALFGVRELRSRKLLWLTLGIPALHILVVSGRTWDWQAGPSFNARYLGPIIPLLALPCAFGVRRQPVLACVLAAYSVEITTLATLVDACPDTSVENPLSDIHFHKLLSGMFSYNLGTIAFRLSPLAGVFAFYAFLIIGFALLWHFVPARDKGGLRYAIAFTEHQK